jgi:hypothetical protein
MMVFVFILVTLSSTVMALTCGVNGNFPCPVCLVPNTEQSNLDKTHPLRTAKDLKALVVRSLDLNAGNREQLLKTQSLRPVMELLFFAYLSPNKFFFD